LEKSEQAEWEKWKKKGGEMSSTANDKKEVWLI